MNSTESLCIPAWCDPKGRRLMWGWNGWIGVLCVDDHSLIYLANDAIPISTPRSEATIEWKFERIPAVLGVPTFDLHIPSHSYRFYLAPPLASAPNISPKLVEQIAAKASDAGSVATLLSAAGAAPDLIGNLGGIAAGLGDLVRLPGAISAQRTGVRNAAALRERLAAL